MSLTERTRPYETLIRHNDDNTVNAHHQKITEILRNDVVISATVLPPQTLTSAEDKDLNFGTIMGEATARALRENDLLKDKLLEAQEVSERLQQEVNDLKPAT